MLVSPRVETVVASRHGGSQTSLVQSQRTLVALRESQRNDLLGRQTAKPAIAAFAEKLLKAIPAEARTRAGYGGKRAVGWERFHMHDNHCFTGQLRPACSNLLCRACDLKLVLTETMFCLGFPSNTPSDFLSIIDVLKIHLQLKLGIVVLSSGTPCAFLCKIQVSKS